MFQDPNSGADAPTVSPVNLPAPEYEVGSRSPSAEKIRSPVNSCLIWWLDRRASKKVTCSHEVVRHLLFGSLETVQATIKLLYKLNYAEPNDWSQPMATGRPNEVMAILMKRVIVN